MQAYSAAVTATAGVFTPWLFSQEGLQQRRSLGPERAEAGVALRPPRGRRVHSKPASPEKVTTDFGAESRGVTAPAPAPQPGRSPSASACEPYREVIELALAHGRNGMAKWQELVDTCGFAAEYKSVNRFVRKLRGSQSPEACAVIETAPGEELQVDYGSGPMVRDPHSGK